MVKQAFAAGSITESIVSFARYTRVYGLNVGIQETQDALVASKELITQPSSFRLALKTIFCTSPEERLLYDRLFDNFWNTNPIDLEETKNKTRIQGLVDKKTNSSLVMLGKGYSPEVSEEIKQVSGANEQERLKKTDLSMIRDVDADELEEIAKKLFREMSLRLRRRLKDNRRRGQVNLRRTIRNSIGYGGEPLDIYRRSQLPKKQRLIVLLDVSGSMDKYSFYLLRFICALKENFRQMEAFIFSTSLIRISKALQYNRLDLVLDTISAQADTWSGGTKIGASLQEFTSHYGRLMLNGSPVVLILSDGLETGDTALLATELMKIQRRSRKLVWLNPLKGMTGYRPIASGMQSALPVIDHFISAHNLESLMELENILENA
jgi:uncharacterized protein with von Willebrand factor type A (vWA) domain